MQAIQTPNIIPLSIMQHLLSKKTTNVRPVVVAGRAVGVKDI
jgi:hypothetical protein